MISKLISLLGGQGPVAQAVAETIKARILAAEEEFKAGQEALDKEFEEREATLLKNIGAKIING